MFIIIIATNIFLKERRFIELFFGAVFCSHFSELLLVSVLGNTISLHFIRGSVWCEAGNLLIALPESAAAAVCTPFTAVYLLTIECARVICAQ